MGRMYTVVDKARAITAQVDLVEILAGTGKTVVVHGWLFTQETETGDAAEEMLRLVCERGVAGTSGSGGTTATCHPRMDNDTACGATVEVGNTTKYAAGTLEELEVHAVNIRQPYLMIYTPEMRPYIVPADRWIIELETTPADSITYSLTVWFEEL